MREEKKKQKEVAVERVYRTRIGVRRCHGRLTGAGDNTGAWEVEVCLRGAGLWSSVKQAAEVSQLVCSVFESFSPTMAVASLVLVRS